MADPSSAVEDALEQLRTAYERVKEFPEASPDGWARMLELRKAVEQLLERV